MVSINTIQSFVKASGVKSILQTKPNTFKGVINPSELKFVPKSEGDVVNFTETTELFYRRNKDKLKKLITDGEGNFVYRKPDVKELVKIPEEKMHLHSEYIEQDGIRYYEKFVSKGDELKLNIEKDFKPFEGDLGILEHGTTEKAYSKILDSGFKPSERFAETFRGTYFTRLADGANHYGEKTVKATVNGKVAVGNPKTVSDFWRYPSNIDDYLKNNKMQHIDAGKLKEMLLKDELQKKGFVGFLSDRIALFGRCKSLVVFDPCNVSIIK